MLSLFRSRIRTAIKDEALQIALDKNADQRLVARQLAYSGLSGDFYGLRKQAHNIRMEVLDNLDSYLAAFSKKAQENGFIIHWAADAEEARKIVLAIAQRKNARLIAKSKSMMSEEINLNPALQTAGMDVVETDLGEFIVQLRNEHPSHIITPAVHLRREDVGETFHQKLGISRTDDIKVLTNTARSFLRQTFLDSEIGISGVNMGVMDTGSICIVTNEGNGRMVTTLPKVHIALMGIERLVPDFDSLSLILKMLPRSATGQKITVYTQIISGPNRSGEVDGAEERHLVLIDNGRSSLINTPIAEILLCIRCGACINACPIFREIGGFSYIGKNGEYTPYPGPIGSVLSPGLFGQDKFGHLAQASTLCGACKEACPMDIDLPAMLLRIRSGEITPNDGTNRKVRPVGLTPIISLGLKIFTWFSTKPTLFTTLQKIAGTISMVLSPHHQWMSLPSITGWGCSKDFPRPAQITFHDSWRKTLEGQEQDSSFIKPTAANKTRIQETRSENLRWNSVVDQFKDEFKALDGKLIETDHQNLSSKIIVLLREKKIDHIAAWEQTYLPESLISDLKAHGIQIDFGSNPNLKVGLTGTDAAISETGTIVLVAGPGRPCSTSLLPETHIAILNQKNIYKNLSQILKLREILSASSFVLISGPSRTADIEMTLTIGVHGPGEVYVFLVNDK